MALIRQANRVGERLLSRVERTCRTSSSEGANLKGESLRRLFRSARAAQRVTAKNGYMLSRAVVCYLAS
jgi:hypothetical protein